MIQQIIEVIVGLFLCALSIAFTVWLWSNAFSMWTWLLS